MTVYLRSNFFSVVKTGVHGLLYPGRVDCVLMVSRFDAIPACDRHPDTRR